MPATTAPTGYSRLQIALHVVGALYHQFVLRDGTLARMRRAQG
ncbi:hypothetical protein [Sulfitobacter pacificus]|jgi:cytochrome b561|nr:hypothetical protein [Sulfitobacter pacificus]